ncbi:MAG: hypothetical protein G8345_03375 [Magnetococcales bacterium]|nr:hypothetical protein [Magnetococcales bacterium]NGZ25915.1 hypothetical protein [Magnetococcales bacterium]
MTQTWNQWRVHHNPASVSMDDAVWKVAFASSDLQEVNQHFGMAAGYSIYELSMGSSRLVEVLRAPAEGGHHRIGERISWLTGCQLMFSVAVGESARQQLAAAGITAVTVAPGTTIASLLIRLEEQPAIYCKPFKQPLPPQQAEERFITMLANGWDE